MGKFKEATAGRNQLILMPQCLDEMISEQEPVRLLCEIMDRLDYSKLESSYPGGGCPAYPPKLLVKALAFAYNMGQRSSRKIAESLRVDLRYIWLSEGLKPDFRTLARFRREKGEYFQELFVQSVRLAQEAGLVLLSHVAIDGSKVESVSGSHSLWGKRRIEQEKEKIRLILEEAEETDRSEEERFGDSDGTSLPDSLRDAESRKRRVDEAERQLRESGKQVISTTEPESRRMMTSRGLRMSYNLQAAVDSSSQVVVGMLVTNDENDLHQLGPMIEEVYDNTGFKPSVVVADKGYYSAANMRILEKNDQCGAVSVPKLPPRCDRPGCYGIDRFEYDETSDTYRCPAGKLLTFRYTSDKENSLYRVYVCGECQKCAQAEECGVLKRGKQLNINVGNALRHKMEDYLATDEGKAAAILRKQIVEPVFGQAKENRRFRRFTLRGLSGAGAESALMFLVHNVFKMMSVPAGQAT
jgi:transposase